MRGSKGFTLIEIMVVIAILGILGALAIPTYKTVRRMAVGSEATAILKQLVDAEVIHFLEKGHYFPTEDTVAAAVWDDDPADKEAIKKALKINLPVGHHLDFQLQNTGAGVVVTISGVSDFFGEDSPFMIGMTVDLEGNVAPLF